MSFTVPRPAEDPTINNIVLVHGAFADGLSWSAVTGLLQSRGYHVTAVQNPLTSLEDDVASTERVLARQTGDVLLVGHSWAGVVITQAGNNPKVKGLVYLSALIPDSGESVADALERIQAQMGKMAIDGNGLIWLDNPDVFRHMIANDIPEPRARVLAAAQQPIAASAFVDKVGEAAWRNKPAWYLITEDDYALSPAVQAHFARQAGADETRISAGHLSIVSQPDCVAALIATAARTLVRDEDIAARLR